MPNNMLFIPRFELRTYCKNCDQLIHMKNPLDHECPKDPEVMKAAEATAKLGKEDREKNRIVDIWEAWLRKQAGLKNKSGCPSVNKEPGECAHQGRCIIFTWGGFDSDSFYRTAIMTNPTWGRVFRKFVESIGVTGDEHHIYLEGLHKNRNNKNRPLQLRDVPEDVAVFEFSTGS